jgi:adenine phosphoribosyltransferase
VRAYLSLIDHRTDGRRCDVTPLFRDPNAFRAAVDDLLELARPSTFNLVAAIDALGLILGTATALHAGVGLVPLRKGGKLPVLAEHVDFDDYDGLRKRLEVRSDAFAARDRVLIVDEWIETGAQALAAALLVERAGASVAGIATLHCDRGPGRDAIVARYALFALGDGENATI